MRDGRARRRARNRQAGRVAMAQDVADRRADEAAGRGLTHDPNEPTGRATVSFQQRCSGRSTVT